METTIVQGLGSNAYGREGGDEKERGNDQVLGEYLLTSIVIHSIPC